MIHICNKKRDSPPSSPFCRSVSYAPSTRYPRPPPHASAAGTGPPPSAALRSHPTAAPEPAAVSAQRYQGGANRGWAGGEGRGSVVYVIRITHKMPRWVIVSLRGYDMEAHRRGCWRTGTFFLLFIVLVCGKENIILLKRSAVSSGSRSQGKITHTWGEGLPL